MEREKILALLKKVKAGKISPQQALKELEALPYLDLEFARLDLHRNLRQGISEVIFGEGKTDQELFQIISELAKRKVNVLITRLSKERGEKLKKRFKKASYNPRAEVLKLIHQPIKIQGRGTILVISAGTGDLKVAEEAKETAEFFGNQVECLYDVGVAGLHRLLAHWEKLKGARVLIVVAGMEGALPSVVSGLVDKPVIAVPTSVGYGASFGGLSALLGMLNTCAGGVAVVNIDNGYGAGVVATLINRL